MSSGAAWLLLHGLWPRERLAMARLDAALLAAELVILALWFVTLASGGREAQAAVRQFFGGDWTAAFWTLVVALGIVTPLAAAWFEHRHGAVPGRAAALLVLAGGLALRWIVLAAGQDGVAARVAELAAR
jgi:formate-dependent nitrite reductase membrane component NrfD